MSLDGQPRPAAAVAGAHISGAFDLESATLTRPVVFSSLAGWLLALTLVAALTGVLKR